MGWIMKAPIRALAAAAAFAIVFAATPGLLLAQRQAPACEDVDGFHDLDFWVGEWDVMVEDRKVGTNRIEKIQNGCAILEHWTSAFGGTGMSLFYYQVATETWKQVWVTGQATGQGGVKEKQLIERLEDGGVRFQGEIPISASRSYLDRTTLTPLEDGSVRQLIEISRDGGATWEATFDASYVQREDPVGGGR